LRIPIYQVDAFTDTVFKGNPAAVCLLEEFLPDEIMLNIASENNLPETAFIVNKGNKYLIRWFTPNYEIDLCGHATLASAYVVLNFIEFGSNKVTFFSELSGELTVNKNNELFSMNFPSRPAKKIVEPNGLIEALGKPCRDILASRDVLVVYDKEEAIINLTPDFRNLSLENHLGIIVTAPSSEKRKSVDFVSRFFDPHVEIPEDPVTGSAHCTLIPYWAEKLGKCKLVAEQLSSRGGKLFCEYNNDRVIISGQAICYLKGEILVENLYSCEQLRTS